MTERVIVAQPISAEAYRPFGDVLSLEDDRGREANQGSARRIDHATTLENLRPRAKANLSLFRCTPRTLPFRIELLERHPHSTQVFLPLLGARFIAVVAEGDVAPDLSTLRAFLVGGGVGVSYRPGVWHHPMIALERVTDFSCLVYEDGTAGDCEEFRLENPMLLNIP